VAVAVGVSVGVSEGVSVGVSVAVLVGVSVGVSVAVAVGVFVGVLVGVSVAVLVGGLMVMMLYTVPILGALLFKFTGWVGMGAVIKAVGLSGELPIIAAFVILALYTYSSGLRAPALIAFVKDIMIYIVVLVAVVIVPSKLGGYGAVFAAANDAFAAKGGATGLTLKPAQMLPYASLALGSAFAAFMYPHPLTGPAPPTNLSVVSGQ